MIHVNTVAPNGDGNDMRLSRLHYDLYIFAWRAEAFHRPSQQ